MKKVKIQILGRSGRMGKELDEAARLPAYSSRLDVIDDGVPDLWIEFSSPEGALELCRKLNAADQKVPLLVGSTGWTEAQSKELEKFSLRFPILRASNFSVGIQLCRITLLLWKTFPEIRPWTVKIRELHHAEKKDSPSGTALTLREVIGGDVPIASVRDGDIVGTHEIVFASESESVTLIHEAKRRSVFAEGALEAAIRLAGTSGLPKRLLSLDDLYLQRDA